MTPAQCLPLPFGVNKKVVLPDAPAKCAVELSIVMTKSQAFNKFKNYKHY